MRCGIRGHDHPTIADLRACSGSGYRAPVQHVPAPGGGTLCSPAPSQEKSSDRPKRLPIKVLAALVPEGRYAIPSRTGSNDLDFFKVEKPTEGKWAGYTFVRRVLGGHDDIRLDFGQSYAALDAISQVRDLREAMGRYGREIGVCGACGRELTDELSRQIGLGPVCREK